MTEKIGVAFYYKDLQQYPESWVNKCIESILTQTYKRFEIYVLDYGENISPIPPGLIHKNGIDRPGLFYKHLPLPNHADAINEIYSWIFKKNDVAVNVHIDDYYAPNRIELLMESLRSGADVASSNFHVIDENNITTWSTDFAKLDIAQELKRNNNPVSNPCHIMKKRVFEKLQFDPKKVPAEDMDLWIRALEAGFKIVIRPEFLHFYRMHTGQVTRRFWGA